MRHPTSFTILDGLEVGTLISAKSGPSMILAKGPIHPDGEGSFAWAVVIRTTGEDHYPFVVHGTHYNDEIGRWCFTSGNYCRDIFQAVEAFCIRTGLDRHGRKED